MIVPQGAVSRFAEVDGFRIHYLEAGDVGRPHLVLMHSCDYGSSAEFSWEHNIPALARHFHIIAPDMLGYGLSDKVYDFGGHMPYRLRSLRRLLQMLCIDDADFIGNSCGASFLLQVAAANGADYRNVLPLRKIVMVSASAIGPPGPGRAIFEAYDGSKDAMRRLVRTIFFSDRWANDEVYVERKHVEGNRPGHWEAVTASRLAMPGRAAAPRRNPPWERCVVPAMFVNGDHDTILAERDGGMDNVRGIRGARFHVVPKSGHCTQIEHPETFHDLVLDFLDPRSPRH